MIPRLLPAHEDHDDAVVALFASLGVEPPMEFWSRAFGEEAPKVALASPWVAELQGAITGYALTRAIRYYSRGDLYDGQLLLDLVAASGPDGDQAARLVLEQLPRKADVTFAIGWGAEPSRFLRDYKWRFVATLQRLRIEVPKRVPVGSQVPPELTRLSRGFGRSIEQQMAADGLCFLARSESLEQALAKPTAGCPSTLLGVLENDAPVGYLRIVERAGLEQGSRELHLLDLRAPARCHEAVAKGLVALAAHRGMPVYVTALCPSLAAPLVALGAQTAAPRHAVYASVAANDGRGLVSSLTSDAPFSLFPADGELDLRTT